MTADSSHPVLTREQVRRVDQIAIERFHIPGIVLMENAARGVVDAIRAEKLPHKSALILCGGGNNGGDGLAVARLLHNAGADVTIGLCTDPLRYKGDALINWRIVQAMKLPVSQATPEWLGALLWLNSGGGKPELVLDAIFGTGLVDPPREPFAHLAEILERSGIPVVAIDLPSGLDCDSGDPVAQRAVAADMTVTFVGTKKGFLAPRSQRYTGKVIVADIGCPREAIDAAMNG